MYKGSSARGLPPVPTALRTITCAGVSELVSGPRLITINVLLLFGMPNSPSACTWSAVAA